VITDATGQIIARGRNRIYDDVGDGRHLHGHGLTHAEVNALVTVDYTGLDRQTCALYTTTEPCPLCIGAFYMSGLRELRYASSCASATAATSRACSTASRPRSRAWWCGARNAASCTRRAPGRSTRDGRHADADADGTAPDAGGGAGTGDGPGGATRGLGVPAALHGASRRRGRKQAITSIAKADRDRYLVERRVNVARRRHG